MRILSWDTSTSLGVVALQEGSSPSSLKLISQWTQTLKVSHSEQLMVGVDEVLQKSGLKFQDVDLIAVGTGPGSFTGLRVGVMTAKTLAHVAKVPLVGVSSLAALVRAARVSESNTALVLREAAMGQVFFFRRNPKGSIHEGAVDQAQLSTVMEDSDVFVIEDKKATRFSGIAKFKKTVLFSSLTETWAGAVGELAMERFLAGERDDPVLLEPSYKQLSAAEHKAQHLS